MATEDVIDLETGRRAVAAGPNDDDILGSWITAISATLDELAGPIVRRTITDDITDGGWHDIRLTGPIHSVTEIIEDQAGRLVTVARRAFGTTPTDGYTLEPHATRTAPYSGTVYRWRGSTEAIWYPGRQNVKATYVAGRFATTAEVSPLFQRAAVLLLKHVWQSHQIGTARVGEYETPAANYPADMVPKAVRSALGDELREGMAQS